MRGGVCLAAAVAAFALAGCGGDEPALTVRLAEEDGSGQSGTATFTPAEDRTTIIVELSNPPQASQPAHIHPGQCGDLGDPIAGLESLVDGHSETTVSMSLEELQSGDLVIHAHKSDAEFDVSVACARIPTS
jgi:hypothetical protein